MIIKYDEEDKPGFTYLLTYHDDVSKVLPRVFTKWANGKGARWSHEKILEKTEQVAQDRTLNLLNEPSNGNPQTGNCTSKSHA